MKKNTVFFLACVIGMTILTGGCDIDVSRSDNKSTNPDNRQADEENDGSHDGDGSNNPKSGSDLRKIEVRNVSGFSEIVIKGVGNLTIKQARRESLSIEADANILPLLTSEISGGRLILGTKPNVSFTTKNPINYYVTVKDLRLIENSGSASIKAEKINTPRLAVVLNGSGNMAIAGKAERQDLSIKGSGNYNASELDSKLVSVVITGSGNAFVNVSGYLEVVLSGSGNLKYKGSATVAQKITGSGSVKRQ